MKEARSSKYPSFLKIFAYGFSLPALRLIHDYLPHRKHRTRVNNPYSEWLAVIFGVLLNFGTISIQHFLADLFLIHSELILHTLWMIIRHIFLLKM